MKAEFMEHKRHDVIITLTYEEAEMLATICAHLPVNTKYGMLISQIFEALTFLKIPYDRKQPFFASAFRWEW